MKDDERVRRGSLHRAASGLGTTGEAQIVERPLRRVEAIVWLIPHRDHPNELGLRLTRFERSSTSAAWSDGQKTTFEGTETERLFRYLAEQRTLAGIDRSTDYVTVALDGSVPDPKLVTRLLGYFDRDPRLFLKVTEHIDAGEVDALLQASNVVRISRAAKELEGLIVDDPNEHAFQRWFEEHPWVFGSEYIERIDLRTIGLDAQADVLLKTADGFADVFEVKRPSADVLAYDPSRNVWRPSANLAAAFGQAVKYLDHLSEQRLVLETRYGIVAYQPRCRIVIGRSGDWDNAQRNALRGFNAHWHGVEALTFDMVLARARALISHLVHRLGRATDQ